MTEQSVTENSPADAETYHGYSVDDEDQPSNIDGIARPRRRRRAGPRLLAARAVVGRTGLRQHGVRGGDRRVARPADRPGGARGGPVRRDRTATTRTSTTARSATSAPAAWSILTRASARTPRRTWSPTTSASTERPPRGGGRRTHRSRPGGVLSPCSTRHPAARGKGVLMFLLWLLAVVIGIAGIVALFRGQILWGIILIILAFVVGPRGLQHLRQVVGHPALGGRLASPSRWARRPSVRAY